MLTQTQILDIQLVFMVKEFLHLGHFGYLGHQQFYFPSCLLQIRAITTCGVLVIIITWGKTEQ